MKRNVSVVCVCSAPNCCDTEQRSASKILISGKIIKEMPGSVASGTHCIFTVTFQRPELDPRVLRVEFWGDKVAIVKAFLQLFYI